MKRTICLIMMLCVVFQSYAYSAVFYDTQEHWSKQFVSVLSDKGIINGYEDGSFKPDSNVNVDEFVKLLLSAIGEKVDFSSGYWAENYLNRAYEMDLIWDDEFNDFSRPITRGEIARLIVRALDLDFSASADKQALIDKISDYYDILNSYKEYVLIAYSNGLITGYEDGSFGCGRNASRAEVSVMITRMLKIKPLDIPQVTKPVEGKLAYYVSPNGNDENEGSLESPFKSIEKARDTIRQLKSKPKEGITVYLRGGVYEIEKTIAFAKEDSGEQDAPITYTSYNGEVARLTGSKALGYDKFKAISDDMASKILNTSARKKVVSYNLKENGIEDYGRIPRRGFLVDEGTGSQMELFINNERMNLARWPNEGYTAIGEVIRSGKRSKSEITKGAVYKYVDPQPSKWHTDIQNIFVSGVLGPNYAYDYYPIGDINSSSSEITLREGAIQKYYSEPFVYYENIFEELDKPGEYYVDRQKGILYLYPPEGMNSNSDIRVSMLKENMITLSGTSFVTFKNLKLDTTRGGFLRSTETNEGIRIENCDVQNNGGAGININNTKNTVIRNNHIYDIGYTALSIGGGDYANLISGNNVVEYNHIHKVAQLERSYNTAITLGYRSVGTVVRNNEIHDTPHTAVIIYGPDHLVEYNNIYDVVKDFHDMDAIYMNVYIYPWERGVTIRQNYIHDLGQRTFIQKQMNVAGVRTDNNGSGLNVVENVFYNIGFKDANQIRGVCAEGTRNVIRNNIFVDTAEAYDGPSPYNPDGKFDLSNAAIKKAFDEFGQFAPVYSKKYPEIKNFWNEYYYALPKSNIYENNLVVNIAFPISTINAGSDPQGFRAAQELVEAKNNFATTKDPGFTDYAKKDFTLRQDSEVYKKIPDFKNIEFDKIGIGNEKVGTY